MDYFTVEYLIWAVALGGISAVSLPLGSLIGLRGNPRPQVVSALAAFGAGALIAALTIEMVAPTLLALEVPEMASHHGDPVDAFFALLAGLATGGIFFTLLNHIVNTRGGFLRHTASTISYLTARKRDRDLAILQDLSYFPQLTDMSPELINSLLDMVKPVRYHSGEVIATTGDPAQHLLFLVEGAVVTNTEEGLSDRYGKGAILGVIALLMNRTAVANAEAEGEVRGYKMPKADFHRLCELSPGFKLAMRQLAEERIQFASSKTKERNDRILDWQKKSKEALITGAEIPDDTEWRMARKAHKGAPLAIWLGILLDGLPESFVIGAGLLIELESKQFELDAMSFTDVIPYTLIAGLFLSNFPEALASSANMRTQGFSKKRIFILWFSLLVITALGAGAGFLLADALSATSVVFAEGLAAGAMLTMIAAAMIPEAVHMGKAPTVGLFTLAGFLAAISFKLLG